MEVRPEVYGLSMVVEKMEVGLVSHGSDVPRRCKTDTLGPLKEKGNRKKYYNDVKMHWLVNFRNIKIY